MDTPAKYIYGCTLIGCRLNTDLAPGHSGDAAASAFTKRGLRVAATIALAGDGFDLAIPIPPHQMAVVRLRASALFRDHADLATMLSEGTFAFAALLYEDREGSALDGPIPAFQVSEIEHLVARLVREAGA